MKKFLVIWRELRYVDCRAEVEAETSEEARKIAQDYGVELIWSFIYTCYEQQNAKVIEIE